jgi:hypothetical protein
MDVKARMKEAIERIAYYAATNEGGDGYDMMPCPLCARQVQARDLLVSEEDCECFCEKCWETSQGSIEG